MALRRRLRKLGTRRPGGFIRVIFETKVTEDRYFAQFCKRGSPLKIEKTEMPIVSMLGMLAQEAETHDQIAQIVSGWDQGYDVLWYVCDCDFKDKRDEVAKRKKLTNLLKVAAKSNANIRIAISNHSFEAWLLLHFEAFSCSLSQDDLEERLAKHMGKPYSKTEFDVDPLKDKVREAVKRARKLTPTSDKIPPNPGTTVWALVEGLIGK
ncbi:MAG: RloB family protein [Candidatus Brocadiia bacterium]